VDFDDDQFMGVYEARFIVLTLARWSKEHGVSWAVLLAGEEVCRVIAGAVVPPHVFGCGDPPEKARREDQQAAEIHARHRGRRIVGRAEPLSWPTDLIENENPGSG
jgi:hypothetical protein